ncbi:hypothetical protein Tco_0642628 [Tanacetum coccineum]
MTKRTPAIEEASIGPSGQPQDDASTNFVRESPSPTDAETGADTDKTKSGGDTEILQIGEEQGDDMANVVNLEDKTIEIDEGQARSDPGKTPESRPPPDDDKMDEDQAGPDPRVTRVALAGPNPEPTHEEFMANVYPDVHESLKFPANEHVILKEPLSSSGTLSSMKNLDDAYTIRDQFLNDKSIEDEPGKLNVDSKVVSMVIIPIHQASSLVPPLSTPIIDLSPPKPISSTTQAPIFTETTMTTTTTLPPPLQQQSTNESELFACVAALEKKLFDFEQKSNTLDNMTRNLGSRAVHVALQAPLRDHFRELPEADMKEILHQRMFETGTYKSISGHVALYEALEASMEWTNMDEFLAEKDKSRKRHRDDQDPPPPPSESDPSKKKIHDSDASGPHYEQPVEDVPMTNTTNISNSEDTDSAHLLKIKQMPEWLKLILEEDIPATLEPDWSIPMNDLPTGDRGSFITWFCKRIRKKKLSKSDLEGPTFKVAKAFHKNNISLQFQMEECHRMLTDQVDLVNPEGHRLVPAITPKGTTRRLALFISKLKAAHYLDFRLEELVSSIWIESEHEYDINAAYGISHWWFKRKEFYITRHSAPSGRSTIRSHMRILSVISLKTYERYGYTLLKEIVLRRADYKEYKILEADFKNLHPNDFEDLYLPHLQGQLNHLSGDEKVHLFNAVNLWIRNIIIKKHVEDLQLRIEKDYTIVRKPRVVIYKDRNDQKKMMRETEVHKFNDGTLNRILEKLDHMVKDFELYEYNPGMETQIWSEDDRRRSKDFMEVIERRLKIQRIFRSLESFVGRKRRDVDFRLI